MTPRPAMTSNVMTSAHADLAIRWHTHHHAPHWNTLQFVAAIWFFVLLIVALLYLKLTDRR